MDDCAGCTYWDGDDGRCRNGNSPEYMRETEDGCELKAYWRQKKSECWKQCLTNWMEGQHE